MTIRAYIFGYRLLLLVFLLLLFFDLFISRRKKLIKELKSPFPLAFQRFEHAYVEIPFSLSLPFSQIFFFSLTISLLPMSRPWRMHPYWWLFKYVNNRFLLFFSPPLKKTTKILAGLSEVIIYSSPDDRRKNRGFCFLEYDSHKSASLAKRRLSTGRVKIFGCDIIVDWADPQEEPDNDTMSKVYIFGREDSLV